MARGWPAVGERDRGDRRAPADASHAPAGVLLLGVRGGDVVRHGPAHRDAPARPGEGAPARGAGDRPTVDGQAYAAFPRPAVLLEQRTIAAHRGEGPARPRAGARRARRAAGHGRARALPADEALARLRELPGVGPFSAEACCSGLRVVDAVPAAENASRAGDRRAVWRRRRRRRGDRAHHRRLAAVPDVGDGPGPDGLEPRGRAVELPARALRRPVTPLDGPVDLHGHLGAALAPALAAPTSEDSSFTASFER